MTDDIFGTATKTNGETDHPSIDQDLGIDPTNIDPNGDPLKELVGEGKKYNTTADLVRAIQEKDTFIERLKEENGGMRDDLTRLQTEVEKATKLDTVLDKMLASRDGESNQPLSSDEVRKLVDTALAERQTEDKQRSNFEASQKAVLDHFEGDFNKAKAFIAEKAEALGMSTKDLMEVATKSPQGFVQLVGVTPAKPGAHVPTARSSEQITQGVDPNPGVGTKAYYSQLRKTNPKLYWSPKIQNQMISDAAKDPDKFYGRR